MELDTCIRGRRSVRAYSEKTVPREMIEAVIEAGTWAPSGHNRQPWKFIVIENPTIIKTISEQTKAFVKETMPQFKKNMDADADTICYNAPVLILICAKNDPPLDAVTAADCNLAAQNMFLKAYELGLGTCYMGYIGLSNIEDKRDLMEEIGLPEGHGIIVPFVLGYPKATQGAGSRKKPEMIAWKK